jgi:hypothetical protein
VAVPGTIWPAVVDGWGSLALAAQTAAPTAGTDWDELLEVQSRLDAQAVNCPENFRGAWLLLSAEIERCRGHRPKALELCNEAIGYARETGNLQLEALASETGARIHLGASESAAARPFLQDAMRCYAQWGATSKVHHIQSRHAPLLDQAPPVEPAAWTTGAAADDIAPVSVDMATVLKLARAIAIEIRLDDLLRTLLAIAMENAGARRSVFLAFRDGSLTIEAEATADPEQVNFGQPVPFETVATIPQAIVQYVRRTGRTS